MSYKYLIKYFPKDLVNIILDYKEDKKKCYYAKEQLNYQFKILKYRYDIDIFKAIKIINKSYEKIENTITFFHFFYNNMFDYNELFSLYKEDYSEDTLIDIFKGCGLIDTTTTFYFELFFKSIIDGDKKLIKNEKDDKICFKLFYIGYDKPDTYILYKSSIKEKRYLDIYYSKFTNFILKTILYS